MDEFDRVAVFSYRGHQHPLNVVGTHRVKTSRGAVGAPCRPVEVLTETGRLGDGRHVGLCLSGVLVLIEGAQEARGGEPAVLAWTAKGRQGECRLKGAPDQPAIPGGEEMGRRSRRGGGPCLAAESVQTGEVEQEARARRGRCAGPSTSSERGTSRSDGKAEGRRAGGRGSCGWRSDGGVQEMDGSLPGRLEPRRRRFWRGAAGLLERSALCDQVPHAAKESYQQGLTVPPHCQKGLWSCGRGLVQTI